MLTLQSFLAASQSSDYLLGSFSGSVIPGPFTSSGNELLIVFHADEYVTGDGFSAQWTSFVQNSGATACLQSSTQQLTGDSGSFGCDGYANSLSSAWHITGNTGERLVLTFDTFGTERNYDIVKVYDGKFSHMHKFANQTEGTTNLKCFFFLWFISIVFCFFINFSFLLS